MNSLGYVKIGVSKHPDIRLKQLQTGNETQLNLLFTEEFNCSRDHLLDIENYIHTMEYYSATYTKKGNPAIYNSMDGP